MNLAAAQTPRTGWHASLKLGFAPRAGRTALVERRQRGPLAVQRPFYPGDGTCHLYLLHPPGGVVGGDRLEIEADTVEGARALVTTPGATKFYLSGGQTAHQTQRLKVAAGSSLEWLPQENIFFPGALVRLDTVIRLEGDARFLGWEIQCFGRPVIDEPFDAGRADFRLHLERDGQPLLLERLRVTADSRLGAAGLRGLPVSGMLLAAPADKQVLDRIREGLAGTPAAATLIDDLLAVRYLGHSTEQCRRLFSRLWAVMRPAVIDRESCAPRIWST